MTVGELMELLKDLDPNTPVHYKGAVGEFPEIDQQDRNVYAKRFGTIKLARYKSDLEDFYAWTQDPFYTKQKDKFEEPFQALVVM